MPDLHANFAYSTVQTAPSPALSGVTLVLQAGDGAKFPAAPFNVTVWPANAVPLATNAEIARCTTKATDTLTIVRTQEASANRAILVGDQVACSVTKKTLLDIEYDTVLTPTDTGTLNNYNPGLNGHTLILLGNATLSTITGFGGGIAGQRVTVMANGVGQIDLSHSDASSTQKLNNIATSAKTSLLGNGAVADFVFDGTLWRLKHHEQGGWITPTFSGASFTASGAMTWTVTGGAVAANRYRLNGRTMSYQADLGVTTIGGTPSAGLQIGVVNFGSFNASGVGTCAVPFVNGNSAVGVGVARIFAAAAISIFIDRTTTAVWTAGANAIVSVNITFEVS